MAIRRKLYLNETITPAFRTWCKENYSPVPPTPSYTTLYYSNGTSSAFSVSTITWTEVGKESATATNTSVIQAIGGTNCTTIGEYAFAWCTSLTTASFPACTSIGTYAFFYCLSLTSITLPDTITSVGAYAFMTCCNISIYTTNALVASIVCNGKGQTSVTIATVYLNGSIYSTFKTGTKEIE